MIEVPGVEGEEDKIKQEVVTITKEEDIIIEEVNKTTEAHIIITTTMEMGISKISLKYKLQEQHPTKQITRLSCADILSYMDIVNMVINARMPMEKLNLDSIFRARTSINKDPMEMKEDKWEVRKACLLQ